MKKNKKIVTLLAFGLIALSSCEKEEFSPIENSENLTTKNATIDFINPNDYLTTDINTAKSRVSDLLPTTTDQKLTTGTLIIHNKTSKDLSLEFYTNRSRSNNQSRKKYISIESFPSGSYLPTAEIEILGENGNFFGEVTYRINNIQGVGLAAERGVGIIETHERAPIFTHIGYQVNKDGFKTAISLNIDKNNPEYSFNSRRSVNKTPSKDYYEIGNTSKTGTRFWVESTTTTLSENNYQTIITINETPSSTTPIEILLQ